MTKETSKPEPVELAKDLAPNERLAEIACARLRSELAFSEDELKAARNMLGSADFRAQSWDSLLAKTIARQDAEAAVGGESTDDSNEEEETDS